VGLPVILILLMSLAFIFSGSGGSHSNASKTTNHSSASRPTTPAAPSTTPPSTTSAHHSSSVAGSHPATTATSTGAGVPTCTPAMLSVTAGTGATTYVVGATPTLFMTVTNISTAPCKQELADKAIVLLVTNGDVRVWASHDCAVEPGSNLTLLMPGVPVRRAIVWSGQTSTVGCTGTRQVAHANTYTLVATLSGQSSPPVTFTLT
jgi:hypothetical protein